MKPYIENYENPQIGDLFMVRTVRFARNGRIFIWPVVDHIHTDEGYGQPNPHYHIDWRFMSQKIINEQRAWFALGLNPEIETEYFVPIMKDELIEEFYMEWEYLRDHCFPKTQTFSALRDLMLQKGAKMKRMRCPHHGTNLLSCKPVDGVVTCPQHGLKWNIKTGVLV
jgi:hypothetical protein